jgi:LacI family transcriptional regulator
MNSDRVPTLNDVAKSAGVSTATVSRCVNNPARVNYRTRTRVLEAVERLGYTPNFGGQALASKRTNTVGAVIPTMENAIFARGLQAFQEELSAAGVTLLVASSAYDADREFEQIKALVGRGADGLMLIGSERRKEAYDYLDRRNVPYIICWNYRDDDKHLYIGFNNRKSARALATRVLEMGHRRVAMIAGETRSNDRAYDRVKGVEAALFESGIEPSEFQVLEAPYSLEAGMAAFEILMRRDPVPTAVICGNDVLAVGAIGRARDMGLDVPGDVSIVGFDDIDLAQVVNPKLTTVHVPHRRMGQAAARVLLERRDMNFDTGSVEFDTEIVERGTLAKPGYGVSADS